MSTKILKHTRQGFDNGRFISFTAGLTEAG
jgi:hypothetical protein